MAAGEIEARGSSRARGKGQQGRLRQGAAGEIEARDSSRDRGKGQQERLRHLLPTYILDGPSFSCAAGTGRPCIANQSVSQARARARVSECERESESEPLSETLSECASLRLLVTTLIHTLKKIAAFSTTEQLQGHRCGTCNYKGAVTCGKDVGAATDLVCVNYKER